MSAKVDKPENDLDVIVPIEQTIVVADVKCRVRRVRTRELMLTARVLTAGLGTGIREMEFEEEGWEQDAVAALVMAIPEAHEEFLELLRVLVEPLEKISDDKVRARFDEEMRNPDVDTSMDVINALVHQEAETFQQLLGKAKTIFKAAQALFRKKSTKKTTG